ncbi:histidinol dehydrogenase [Paludibacter sp.]|uniref:histidinol dehydrogenase n=1 Tax=Paludibacter sp. TaxID=1898105 RepID=UPI001354E749|nr:histidinol dehydrogenase [Paludibacter sp.]MTK54442.1 histidinol dehydrogenase [Paludibacter sp.]
MQIIKKPSRQEWAELLKRPEIDTTSLFGTVGEVLENIRQNGDKAVFEYELKFDKVQLSALQVSAEEIAEAEPLVPHLLKEAISQAKRNIEKFHDAQNDELPYMNVIPEVRCWQKRVAIQKVGLYIPGGTAPLFSTVLMLAIPAQLAGCEEIVLCSPPNTEGKIHPAVLYAANLCGVTKIFKIGGAQAIAAMAYGTESVPKVYKIFGPGNQYVTAAKQLISLKNTAIDMPAGPSEVAIIADNTAKPRYIAADLLSQAEHGVDSQSILITTDESLIVGVQEEVKSQLELLPRKDLAEKALQHSKIIYIPDIEEAIAFTNEYAPEHLIIMTHNYTVVAERIINAGSVFLGEYSPESAGDYASGTNHTLPTNGYAKAYSGVHLDSFTKKITYQELSREGLSMLSNAIEIMAENESLIAHKNAVEVRLERVYREDEDYTDSWRR